MERKKERKERRKEEMKERRKEERKKERKKERKLFGITARNTLDILPLTAPLPKHEDFTSKKVI